MKSIVLFVAASLMLVGAMVAIAIPNPVEAAPKFLWCYTAASIVCAQGGDPFNSKGECKKADAEDQLPTVEPCHKVPLS
jgi:hypothetical protein